MNVAHCIESVTWGRPRSICVLTIWFTFAAVAMRVSGIITAVKSWPPAATVVL